MGVPYRCVNKTGRKRRKLKPCGYRETLPARLHYKECPKCGCEMKPDETRRAYTKTVNCRCGGVYGSSLSGDWPHRRGCLGCEYYQGDIDLEEEYHKYA